MTTTKNTTTLLLLALISLLIGVQQSHAQKSNYNWLFGDRAAISFKSGNGQASFINPQKFTTQTASISHPETGELIFYTNGTTFWNSNHDTFGQETLPGNFYENIIIIPYPSNNNKYFVFIAEHFRLYYAVVDMSANGGLGKVSQSYTLITNNVIGQFALVKHKYLKGVSWLVAHEVSSNLFLTFKIDTGVSLTPVVSNIGLTLLSYGGLTSNNQGSKIVLTHIVQNNNAVQMFDFDGACGTLSNPILLPRENNWGQTRDVTFSANDSKLYLINSNPSICLVQLHGPNFQNYTNINANGNNMWNLRLGPDNKIYISTYSNLSIGKYIDYINFPDLDAPQCELKQNTFNLDDGTGRTSGFRLPEFEKGRTIISPIRDSIFSIKGQCVNQTSTFIYNTNHLFDFITWEFEPGKLSNQITAQYTYTKKGKYPIKLIINRCDVSYVLFDSITVGEAPEFDLPTDTFKCAVNTVTLNGPTCDNYLWSTGSTQQTITGLDTGLVWLKAGNGSCFNYDTITIKNYPDIIKQLGSEYFLCEDEKEVIKLDAGEGFIAYKWTPTNDTTQWIMVKQVGDYFVKVTDNTGCIGDDNTKVKRKCGVILHVPNIFTPNNDGYNDVFLPVSSDVVSYELKVYNRWGQLVFTSADVGQGWDGTINGKTGASDVYVYQITYQGYQNKVLKTFTKMGNVTLVY